MKLATDQGYWGRSEGTMEPIDLVPARERAHEILKYMRSIPLDNLNTTAGSEAQLSSDPALTAFAQLGACRLNCDRSMISILGLESQIVIAEATRTISLLHEKHHDPGDGLVFGTIEFANQFGICPSTVDSFLQESCRIDSDNIYADRSRYIIYDLAKEERFKNKPAVTGPAKLRFYAEVPIKSPAGYLLGSYCVVDSTPRTSFSESEYLVLQEIATAIMGHLDLLYRHNELCSAERLLQGLSLFVEGESSLRQWSIQKHKANAKDPSQTAAERRANTEVGTMHQPDLNAPLTSQPNEERETPHNAKSLVASSTASQNLDLSVQSSSSSVVTSPLTLDSTIQWNKLDYVSEPDAQGNASNEDHLNGTVLRASQAKPQSTSHDNVQKSFSRASNLLREAMDFEGFVFLDAAPSVYSSFEGNKHPLHRTSRLALSRSNTASLQLDPGIGRTGWHYDEQSETSQEPLHARIQMCKRLGYATRNKSSLMGNVIASEFVSLPQEVLQQLIVWYPNGKVFNYDENGLVMSVDESHGLESRRRRFGKPRTSHILGNDDCEVHRIIMSCFPGVRSLAFIPQWDSARDKWYAAGIGWTTDAKRVVQSHDLTYMVAYSNSVMSEIARVDLREIDRAKSDFISSISHELRSPLHGILGSAELLRDLCRDGGPDQTNDTIGVIENCGTTLLDTMDHLLDFAKINSLTRVDEKKRKRLKSVPEPSSSERIDLTTSFDLSLLVEEVVESLLMGHQFRRHGSAYHVSRDSRGHGTSDPLTVILDISKRSDWMVLSEAGAWRRILMNLLGNSLKYTQTGYIEVTLHALEANNGTASKSADQLTVNLAINDSGKGISREYLQHHLFEPFVQEDNLSVGTGLGLSIVKQIINCLGGSIDVRSELGVGTETIVSVPVQISDAPIAQDTQRLDPSLGEEVTLCLQGLDPTPPEIQEASTGILSREALRLVALKKSLSDLATTWFGLKVTTAHATDQISNTDILVIRQEAFESADASNAKNLNQWKDQPIVVLCDATIHKPVSRNEELRNVQYMTQPFGPKKMARVLKSCKKFLSDPGVDLRKSSAAGLEQTSSVTKSRQTSTTAATIVPEFPITNGCAMQPTVLCVDDNEINLKLLEGCMQKLQCPYFTACNGLEAVQCFQEAPRPIDYIFMDLSMPIMDGFTASRKIREIELERSDDALAKTLPPPEPAKTSADGFSDSVQTHRTTIIALTGLGSAKAQQEAAASGVDVFLPKPTPMKKIRQLIIPPSET